MYSVHSKHIVYSRHIMHSAHGTRSTHTACRAHLIFRVKFRTRLVVQVVAQLHGERLLPWEGPRSGGDLERLGMLRGAVMHLLERDPTQRCTAQQFHSACRQVFSDNTAQLAGF